MSVKSIVHQNPNLVIGESNNTLKCLINILAVTDGVSVATCTTVEMCGISVGGFLSAPVESAPVADITCKINRYKQS